MTETPQLLTSVLDQYRTSGDFNGFYIGKEDAEVFEVAIELTNAELIQVVSEDDYVNPHIRPWPSKRSIDDQVESIRQLKDANYGLCLYPTPLAIAEHPSPESYPEEPFLQAMADGRGTLELAFFRFDVLEQYRNDPRFEFHFYDFGSNTVISDDVYQDEQEPDHDKIMMSHIGFAYDLSEYDREDPTTPIVRRVCAFYGDLAKLTPVHQQRWKTYQVEESEALNPHPVWWSQAMGHFADGLGPFERFTFELGALNELTTKATGEPLFRTTERPREFGWILRPSQHEWDAFIHLLDKLLSENLRNEALDAAGAPKETDQGERLGTIKRLAALLRLRKIQNDLVKEVVAPFEEVREARMRPAHALRANIDDKSFIHKQVALLQRVNLSLQQLRWWWQSHPANEDWEEPDYAAADARQYRL